MKLHLITFTLGILALAALLAPQAAAYPLTEAQEERIRLFLPKAYEKLKRREPIHVAVVGDGISQMITYDEHRYNVLMSLHGHLLRGVEAEFYYTGGVHLINPIGENPEKLNKRFGPEITMQQFAQPTATSLSAMQMLTTRVFLNPPDIVLINFGQNDLRSGILLDTYRRSLEAAIQLCRAQGAEAIIIGPTPVRDPLDPPGWGATRCYSWAARGVAKAQNVMFLDPGLALMETTGAPSEGELEERSRFISESLASKYFQYGSDRTTPEAIFMNAVAHERAGRGMMEQFLNGQPPVGFSAAAEAFQREPGKLRIEMQLTNDSEGTKYGVLTALNIGRGWQPTEPYREFDLEPGAAERFAFTYERRVDGVVDGKQTYFPIVNNRRSIATSFLVSDQDSTGMLDLSVTISPVSVVWDLSKQENQSGVFPIKFNLYNPADTEVSGTYHLTYASQQARGAFRLGSRESRDFEAKTKLPAEGLRAKDLVKLEITSGESLFEFQREVEVLKNVGLKTAIPLSRASRYLPGTPQKAGSEAIGMTVEADSAGLTVVFDIKGIGFEQAEQKHSFIVDLTIDGRPREEIRSFGFVAPLRIVAGPGAGKGKTSPILPASFGNGYDKLLDAGGVTSELTNEADGKTHKFVVKIPRIYLYRHEWKPGSGLLGIGANLQFLRVDTGTGEFNYPPEARWVSGESRLHVNDSDWLTTLEFREGDPDLWSIRIY
ncbi:MAG: hypothetical protein ACI8UO_004760 [Verrucomicrobiales bacterium]